MIYFPDKLRLEDAGFVGGQRLFRHLERFRYVSSRGIIEAPPGAITDGASIPKAFHSILSPYGSYFKSAVIHDELYSERNDRFDRLESDLIFKEAMFNEGVPWEQREIVFNAVRAGGAKHFKGTKRMKPILPERVARIAESKIGLRESGRPNSGHQIREFLDADSYRPNATDDGYPWCASFVCRIVQLAMEGREWTFIRPTTPGAWAFEKWSLAQDRSTWTLKPPGKDIRRGDIVVFKFSHIGIAVGSPDKKGWVRCVEGNTNKAGSREGDGVYLKVRNVSTIRSRIRFRV